MSVADLISFCKKNEIKGYSGKSKSALIEHIQSQPAKNPVIEHVPPTPTEPIDILQTSKNVTLYHGDCMEIMKTIPDGSVDMILVDLPYGMTKNSWDTVLPFDAMWAHYNRIIKPSGAIVLFANNPFGAMLIASNLKQFRYSLVWEKNKFSDFLNAKRKPMKIHEDIHVFYKSQPTYNAQKTKGEPYERWNKQEAVDSQTNYGKHNENHVINTDGTRLPTTILKFKRIERPQHPTQKPTDLLEWLIKTYTNEGDCVLDSCMGSGSTGVACINTNRRFIGIELEKEYFEICQKRCLAPTEQESKSSE